MSKRTSTSTPVGQRSPKAAKHNDDDASTPSDGESKATHDRTPALTDLAREILLLTKSRREVLQEFMDDHVEHVVSIWFDHERKNFYLSEPVLWNPIRLRFDDVSERRCEKSTQLKNSLRARGYFVFDCEDPTTFATKVPTAAMQAHYLK